MEKIVLDVFMKVGDRVQVQVDPETRGWCSDRYKNLPDGKEGTIIGFHYSTFIEDRLGLMEPGIYSHRTSPLIQFPDGQTTVQLSPHDLVWVDPTIKEARRIERSEGGKDYDNRVKEVKRIGDLPYTDLWEYDVVRVIDPNHWANRLQFVPLSAPIFAVHRINYNQYLDDQTLTYAVGGTFPDGSTTGEVYLSADKLELVERGNFWKYHNGQRDQLKFADIHDEIKLAKILHAVNEVRNPRRDDLYLWTRAEALTAIRDGRADGFYVSHGFFGSGPSIRVERFDDRGLGERVRQKTIEGFADTPEGEADPEMDARVEKQMKHHR